MPLQPVPIVGGAYSDSTLPFDLQDCVNYLPELAENQQARSQGVLRGVPGLTLLCATENSAVRGVHNVEGQLFAVVGGHLYSISTAGVATAVGAITGYGRVSMSHNQQSNGYELVIAAGADGFVYNTGTLAFTQITSENWKGSICTNFIDGYITHVEPFGLFWYHSNLADALTYLSTDEYEAEAQPDRIVSQITSHEEVWTFGARTIQIFVDAGAQDATFEVQQGTLIEQGCAGTYTPASLDNTVFWLGNDGIVYRADGYIPVRVSTHAVEQSIANCDWDQAYGFAWTDRGHKVYYLTFPDGLTWGYDVATKLWHRRESYGLKNWRVNSLVYWNGQWIGGDAVNGNLYTLDWNNFTEAGQPLVSRRRTPYAHANQNQLTLAALELYMDTGHTSLSGDESVWMRYSDDAGKTWSNWKQRLLAETYLQRSRIRFLRLGRFRNRVFEVMVSSPIKRDIIAASVDMHP